MRTIVVLYEARQQKSASILKRLVQYVSISELISVENLLCSIDDAMVSTMQNTRDHLCTSTSRFNMLADFCWRTLELSNQPLKEMYISPLMIIQVVPVPSRNQLVQTCVVPL